MIIETTIGNLDETISKYDNLLWKTTKECTEIQEDEATKLWISWVRIQVPDLGVSLRSGDRLSQQGGEYIAHINPETGEPEQKYIAPEKNAPWDDDMSISVLYDIDEKDPSKYNGWSGAGFMEALVYALYPKVRDFTEIENVSCFIDTSEFLEDEEKAQTLAKECEENYEE